MQKILIVHTAFIGDIILATPLIPAIKNAYPDCLIDFITIPASANLLEKETDLNKLIIFDKRGSHKGIKGLRRIIRLVNENQYAGLHSVTWDGKNELGQSVSSGMYFYQLKSDNGFLLTKKLILLK